MGWRKPPAIRGISRFERRGLNARAPTVNVVRGGGFGRRQGCGGAPSNGYTAPTFARSVMQNRQSNTAEQSINTRSMHRVCLLAIGQPWPAIART